MKNLVFCVLSGLLAGACASAQDAAPRSTPALAAQVAAAAAGHLSQDSTVDQILDALHARGTGLKDFVADVSMDEIDALTGIPVTHKGTVRYQSLGEGNGRIRVNFDQRLVDKAPEKYRVEYLLDGGWLIDRDYLRKQQVRHQVLQPGQKMNLLKLGEGPFPLPIGQPKEEVGKLFEVKKVASAKDDPKGTVHGQLIPKPKTQFANKFQVIDVWVDVETHFPKRISTTDRNGTMVKVTDLSDIRINTGLGDEAFRLDPVQGWETKDEPLE